MGLEQLQLSSGREISSLPALFSLLPLNVPLSYLERRANPLDFDSRALGVCPEKRFKFVVEMEFPVGDRSLENYYASPYTSLRQTPVP
jgi:hypothetical protein